MSRSLSSSNLSEQRWVNQISKHFSIDIDPQPCVLRVPKSLVQQKPESYAPKDLRLGPYQHCFISDLHDAQKIEALQKFLSEEQFTGFKTLVVDKLKQIEPAIRACYDQFLDLDSETLAWILAIDGTYLLHLLSFYLDTNDVFHPEERNFVKDIVMLENQIPALVLRIIKKSLGFSDKACLEFSAFCTVHSPFPVEKNIDIPSDHLLDCMSNMILQFVDMEKLLPNKKLPSQNEAPDHTLGLLSSTETTTTNAHLTIPETAVKALEALADLLKGTAAQKPIHFVASLPWQMCLGRFQMMKKPSVDEIRIPSVRQLHDIAKLKFEITPGGIRSLNFDKVSRTLYLPKIILNADSEVILRNLVAYEAATAISDSKKSEIADYVDLMCGIIDTAEDAKLLKDSHIIESNLNDQEIADIFNGIIKSSRMKDCLEEITQALNELYDNTNKVRIWRFLKKQIIPSDTCIKVWSFIFQILVVVLLSLEAYCDIFGCRVHWFG